VSRAKTRGLDLDEFFTVDDVSPVSEPVRVHLVSKRHMPDRNDATCRTGWAPHEGLEWRQHPDRGRILQERLKNWWHLLWESELGWQMRWLKRMKN